MRDLLRVQVDQYGIEIDAAAARIARVALWITDHQMNLLAAQRLGQPPSVPLTHSATIVEGNAPADRLGDRAAALAVQPCGGNPPFVGASP